MICGYYRVKESSSLGYDLWVLQGKKKLIALVMICGYYRVKETDSLGYDLWVLQGKRN